MTSKAETEFSAFVRGARAQLLAFAWTVSGDPATAEDLVQTALIKLWLKWNGITARGDPTAYVRTAIYHQHVSSLRRLTSYRRLIPSLKPLDESSGLVDASEDKLLLRAALLSLPKKQRAVIFLRFIADLSEADTAQITGTSLGTVKSQASKGLSNLRERVTPQPSIDGDQHDQRLSARPSGRRSSS